MKSFCFILTPLEVEGNLPFEVIPGHFFQRADAEQVKLIKEKLLLHLEPSFIGQYHRPQYEFDWLPPTGGAGSWAQNLGSQANVLSFLNEVVKLLLLFAPKEPVFLADLKNC